MFEEAFSGGQHGFSSIIVLPGSWWLNALPCQLEPFWIAFDVAREAASHSGMRPPTSALQPASHVPSDNLPAFPGTSSPPRKMGENSCTCYTEVQSFSFNEWLCINYFKQDLGNSKCPKDVRYYSVYESQFEFAVSFFPSKNSSMPPWAEGPWLLGASS